jgi:hypothetical protein
MINSFVPVIDGLSPDEETKIFTQALQVKDKIGELKKQESSLVKVRNQLLEMQKNIDKSKLVSADENKLKQALNAVNFLIDGIQS